jgi:hypothetical protein
LGRRLILTRKEITGMRTAMPRQLMVKVKVATREMFRAGRL